MLKISFYIEQRMRSQLHHMAILVFLTLLGCNTFNNTSEYLNSERLKWQAMDSLNAQLPGGIRVYETQNEDPNIRAWYVYVPERTESIETRVVASIDEDGKETISEFAQRLNAPVVINGGYFRMDLNPSRHVGILQVDSVLIEAATPSVLRGETRFFLHRAAIGFGSANRVEIGWVSSHEDTVFKWDRGISNLPDQPGDRLNRKYASIWGLRDILGGGPRLLQAGKKAISINEEVFFGTSIPETHPRTAAGITSEGDLILLLVDGRQMQSRGANLQELADILLSLGCVEGLNLDGGGSSALVVNGRLLNRPAGATTQREVMSALAVFHTPKSSEE